MCYIEFNHLMFKAYFDSNNFWLPSLFSYIYRMQCESCYYPYFRFTGEKNTPNLVKQNIPFLGMLLKIFDSQQSKNATCKQGLLYSYAELIELVPPHTHTLPPSTKQIQHWIQNHSISAHSPARKEKQTVR